MTGGSIRGEHVRRCAQACVGGWIQRAEGRCRARGRGVRWRSGNRGRLLRAGQLPLYKGEELCPRGQGDDTAYVTYASNVEE